MFFVNWFHILPVMVKGHCVLIQHFDVFLLRVRDYCPKMTCITLVLLFAAVPYYEAISITIRPCGKYAIWKDDPPLWPLDLLKSPIHSFGVHSFQGYCNLIHV